MAYDARLGIAVLADGMGGLRAGEVASATAVATVMEHLADHAGRLTDGGSALASADTLRGALELANRRVHALADTRQEYAGMGTTLVVGVSLAERFIVAHVGDSRAYRFRAGALTRLTSDHSLVQLLVEEGILSPSEARRAPNRNIVTRAVGIEADVEVDVNETDTLPRDLYLLCSDGLTDMIDDPTIARLCAEQDGDDEPAHIVDRLIDAALTCGGFDNVSVVAVRI